MARIWILGAGAVGTALGGLFAQRGHEVGFPGKSKTKPSAAASPLRVALPDRFLGPHAVQTPGPGGCAVRERPDHLFVCLGRNHLRVLTREALKPLIDVERTCLTFCNADPTDAGKLDAPAASRSHILALLDAVKLQEGDTEITAENPCLVLANGSPVLPVVEGFAALGIGVRTVEDVRPCLDSLFVAELLFLPIALCNTTPRHFLSFPAGRKLAGGIIAEGLRVMEKCGRPLAPIPVGDPRELAERLKKDAAGSDRFRRLPDRAYPPALQAYLRGAQGEARELNKRIVEMGASVGLELPLNWRLYQKAGRPAGAGFYRDPAELEAALLA